MLERQLAPHELLVDRPRVVGVLAPAEAQCTRRHRAAAAAAARSRSAAVAGGRAGLGVAEVAPSDDRGRFLAATSLNVKPLCSLAASSGAAAKSVCARVTGVSAARRRAGKNHQVPSRSGSVPASEAWRPGVERARRSRPPPSRRRARAVRLLRRDRSRRQPRRRAVGRVPASASVPSSRPARRSIVADAACAPRRGVALAAAHERELGRRPSRDAPASRSGRGREAVGRRPAARAPTVAPSGRTARPPERPGARRAPPSRRSR